MRNISYLVVAVSSLVITGCATDAFTPTVETRQSIVSYDIQNIDYLIAADQIVATHRSVMSSARIERNFAPDPLPAQPGRITMSNPLHNSPVAGMAQFGGAQFLLPSCDGSQLVITSDDTSFGRYGETTRYTSCVGV